MNTERKVLIGIAATSLLILLGGIWLVSKSSDVNVPEDQIIARQGLHWHPKLTVTIKGQSQELGENIGMGAVHGKLHTHTEDFKQGVVHMEMKGLVIKERSSDHFQRRCDEVPLHTLM